MKQALCLAVFRRLRLRSGVGFTGQATSVFLFQNLPASKRFDLGQVCGQQWQSFWYSWTRWQRSFGKGGYNHQIFNDGRGKLDANAYGSRVLSPYGDSTKFGAGLNWADQNAKAGLDLSKSIGGHTALKATGEGLWNFKKDSSLSAGGFYSQPFLGHGRPDYGFQAEYKRHF